MGSYVHLGMAFEQEARAVLLEFFSAYSPRCVQSLGGANDRGIDLIMGLKGGITLLVQCKRTGNKVPPKQIRELEGVSLFRGNGLLKNSSNDSGAADLIGGLVGVMASTNLLSNGATQAFMASQYPLMFFHMQEANIQKYLMNHRMMKLHPHLLIRNSFRS